METGKGYDVQFATAATLMFRYYGIPARYAEGYLLTPEDAEKMKAGEGYDLPLKTPMPGRKSISTAVALSLWK